MKFSDIDFSAISRMMDSMSDEQKEKMNEMADDMMSKYAQNQEEIVESQEDMYEFLQIDEEDYSELPGIVLDQMEAACDLEQYYEDVRDSDFSGSILFLCKALVNMLRKYHYPIYKNVLNVSGFTNESMTTLYSYFSVLMNEETIHTLVDEGFGSSELWVAHKNLLSQAYILLNRAEYDSISYEELQNFKDLLFNQKGLLNITNLQ